MTIRLVKEDETRYNKKRNDIKCRMCKSNETRTQSNGEPIWIKDKNIKGLWTGYFLCYDCAYKIERICYRCGSGEIIKSIQMSKHYNKDGIWTGKYICRSCYHKDYIDHKNKNINLTISEGGGSLTDIIVAAVLEVPTCSIYVGDKRLPFSLIHGYYGIIGTKSSRLDLRKWYFNINDYVPADTYYLIGFDEKLKNIEKVFIIAIEDKIDDGRLFISKNSKKYKKFEVDSMPYNNIYQNVDFFYQNGRAIKQTS